VNILEKENKGLKEELMRIHTLVKKTGVTLSNSISEWIKSKPTSEQNTSSTPSSPQKGKVGVCLLIILLSFGLCFGRDGPFREYINRGRDSILLREKSFPLSMWAGSPQTNVVGRRQLLQNEEISPPESKLLPTVPPVVDFTAAEKATMDHSNKPRHKISIDGNIPQKMNTAPASYHEEIHRRITGNALEHTENPLLMVEVMNESIHHNVSEFESKETEQWFSERLKLRPNTAFFSVSDFQQIIPTDMTSFDSGTPFFISLLVPSKTLANQLPPNPHVKVDNSIIEVTCQVLAVNHTTLNLEEVNKIRQVPIVS